MATNFRPWEEDGLYGTFYMFDKAREGIAMHAHVTPDAFHNTRCLKGSVEIYGDGVDTVLHAGETADFKSYRMHELVALEDGTEIVNILLNGPYKGYTGLDDPIMHGAVAPDLYGRGLTYG